jgi:hypothetical protein
MFTKKKVLTSSIINQLIGTKNKIFNVTFRKKNGEVRTFNAIKHSEKYLKGGTLTYVPSEHRLVTCFSLDDLQYKSFSVDRLVRIKANGVEINF